MSTIEEIEDAVRRLSSKELAAFRAWFAQLDAAAKQRVQEYTRGISDYESREDDEADFCPVSEERKGEKPSEGTRGSLLENQRGPADSHGIRLTSVSLKATTDQRWPNLKGTQA